jgi:myosin V
LTGLQHLHEPAILFSLEDRYNRGSIYTFTGPILIAVNPFQDMKELYSKENLALYLDYEKLNGFDNKLKPHAYSIAGAAYGNMMAAMGTFGDKSRPRNQSILISGESGAG